MAKKNIEVLFNKSNLPIIQVEHEGHMLPVHSKYNPVSEAERLIDAYASQIEENDHIFFYGVGLGYHIKVAQQRYPEKLISIYEPFEEVFDSFISNKNVIGIHVNKLVGQYVERTEEDIKNNLNEFKVNLAQRIFILIHPVYEKIAQQPFKQFSNKFQEIVENTKGQKQITNAFNERWLINTIMNAKYTFSTPNILSQQENPLEGKPVLLVSAGPSLSEELDNLRIIKEQRLAYIFAVGAANEALIAHEIYPDAVLSYDPTVINATVFEKLAAQHITDIPIIFGTSVGHETLSMFPGPLIHMVMNRDKITPFLHETSFATVNDATTISNVTLQLLHKLQVEQVILVGQNFAYKNDIFYAEEIERYNSLEFKNSIKQQKAIYVEDVYGGQVQTEQGYIQMRQEMEQYIQLMPDLKIINTTKGGAKIAGTQYQPLDDIISNLKKSVVEEKWWGKLGTPTEKLNFKVIQRLVKACKDYIAVYNNMKELLRRLEKKADSNNPRELNRMLEKMYRLLSELTKNPLFEIIIGPLISIHTERFYSDVKLCQSIIKTSEKIKTVCQVYGEYMLKTLNIYQKISPILQMHVISKMGVQDGFKFYESSSGVIHYEGDWRKKWLMRQEFSEYGMLELYGTSAEALATGATLKFKFSGTAFKLIGVNHAKSDLRLKFTINQKEKIVTIRDSIDEDRFSSFYPYILFESPRLLEGMHEVTVQILSNQVHCNILGVEISEDGRVYHIDEVEDVEQLEVGKRIRCHYEARYNELGNFTNLGDETADTLPLEATSNPDGDFYFITVDKNENQITLVADRILQSNISKNVIINKEITQNQHKGIISLLTSSPDLQNSEWDRYLVSQSDIKTNNLKWNADSVTASWVNDLNEDDTEFALLRGSCIGEDGVIKMEDGFGHSTKCLPNKTLKMNGYRPKLVIDCNVEKKDFK
ncbi:MULTISPECIES: motility associated factor glycosyltransferase family protein [Lysinibacillus]|uniref:motility associated factor glycosyltransferase family protein n=1 Tax=Lysinibacillus TaxID=400634 RepID=UPI00214AC837|nr:MULTISPECIES: 6-hydroxymethylpterin diphosphokinase MptE-like protein [Lysinibacillus]UUV25132.1 DUF115 domain-containing protein [Lysinibacillus sp. FN11]UYB48004.1 DUF115 domain-containing protein [Lysinibacillus capsici]